VARNVELKAVDPDPDRTLRAALDLGAEDRGVIEQRDTYFAVPRGRLKLREQTPGEDELIAYHRPDDPTVRVSAYERIPVADAAAARTGLEATCGVRVVVEKRRRLLLWDGVRIHLDDVTGLGRFLELEAVAADGSDLGEEERKVAHLREVLDIPDESLRPGSYSDALMQAADDELLALARGVAPNAYAPYSNLHIGAALRTEDGRRFAGANVENAAYPQGQCAEASAIGAMVAGGGGRIAEVVVASEHAVAPCGGCRQRLAEFAGPDARVFLVDAGRVRRATTVGELLPLAFDRDDLP
jgi:homotetrameric cytidine deaminase